VGTQEEHGEIDGAREEHGEINGALEEHGGRETAREQHVGGEGAWEKHGGKAGARKEHGERSGCDEVELCHGGGEGATLPDALESCCFAVSDKSVPSFMSLAMCLEGATMLGRGSAEARGVLPIATVASVTIRVLAS
jgi:hypothetical protein